MLDGSQWLQWSPAFSGRVNFALTAAHQHSILCVLVVLRVCFLLCLSLSAHTPWMQVSVSC